MKRSVGIPGCTGPLAAFRAPVEQTLSDMAAAGADCFVLGCTELPIVRGALALPGGFVRPTEEPAKAVIRW